jgi:hypothetical protein
MNSATSSGEDAVRTAILTAMDRLLAGTPVRSTGRLSISQLALEAGVKRWYLTHQHLDLKTLFQARVKAAHNTPAASRSDSASTTCSKTKHVELLKYTAELEDALGKIGYQRLGAGMPERLFYRCEGKPAVYHLHIVTTTAWDTATNGYCGTTFVATPRTAISTPDSSESLPSQAAVAMHTPGESRL